MNCYEMFDQYESRLRALYISHHEYAETITERLKMVEKWRNKVAEIPQMGSSFIRHYTGYLRSDDVFIETMLGVSKTKVKDALNAKVTPDVNFNNQKRIKVIGEENVFEIFLISSDDDLSPENKTPSGSNTPDVLSKSKIGGDKFDDGKPRMDLLDPYAIEQLSLVLGFGAKKYAAHNWRKGLSVVRMCAAVLRHMFALLRGETDDPETGLSHAAHAMCECMFIIWTIKNKPEMDDRTPT